MTIILYNVVGSPPCNLVRSLAKHAGIELKLRNLDFANKEHLGAEYLKYAPESELYPACIQTRTRIDLILASIATTIHTAGADFMRPRIRQKTKPTTEELVQFEQNYVRGLEHLIGDGKFAVGDKFTVGDMALTTRIVVALEVMHRCVFIA
ncbi:hypothetical protein MTO96_039217 [Rhipicephalus appendiculatus]